MITVKGVDIGYGIPKVIVPVMEQTKENIMDKVAGAILTPCDAIELRLDSFEELFDSKKLKELLKDVYAAVCDKILLVTIRTSFEGGLVEVTSESYAQLLDTIMESGCVDLLDMEEALVCDESIEKAKKLGIATVMSCHHFEGTPSEEEMQETLARMEQRGASIAKMAVMANEYKDLLTLLRTARTAQRTMSVPRILISMGQYGMASRIAGEAYGIAMTFASDKCASAPGQLNVYEVQSILKGIHTIRQSDRLVYLTGFMGSGKSSVGRNLGLMTGQMVYEMDDMIEEAAGCTISEIFAKQGEEEFRRRETDVLKYLSTQKGGIVSCGGGAVTRSENVSLMKKSGDIFYLTANADTIMKRLAHQIDKRPLLQGEDPESRVRDLMAQRQEVYTKTSNFMISTDGKTLDQVTLETILMVEKASEVE
ncbi:MAG: type I 3-dehydroquinate dehydratase [Lachnospiraceae bacterium]|nr:type I 3-dehydroquinate dehydratase [Candidatus Equihabitans merdae]